MRTDDDDLRVIAGHLRLDIMAELPMNFVTVSPGPQPRSRKGIFNEISGSIKLGKMPHISLAYFTRQFLEIRAKLLA
jgi:hypothetical protein